MVNIKNIAAYLIGATLLSYASLVISRKTRYRRFGVKPFLRQRPEYGQFERMFLYIKEHDEGEFFGYTRMTPRSFQYLLEMVEFELRKHPARKNAIQPEMRLALTLHYLAEGLSMREIARNYYIGHSTAHVIIRETCQAIWKVLMPIYMPPPTEEHFLKIAETYFSKWKIPNCLGSLDGKHCVVQAPYHSGSLYFSYKKSFSIVLMGACDANYKFTMVDIGAPGSYHDSFVFKNSLFGRSFMQKMLPIPAPRRLPQSEIMLPFYLAADQAFPLHENIMRPYPGERLSEEKRTFNYRLSRGRNTIENTFGILSQRWRCLRKGIVGDTPTCELVIKACVILHNFLQGEEEELPVHNRHYCPAGFVDEELDNGDIIPGQWRNIGNALESVGRISANNASRRVQANRDALEDYFVSPTGSLSWQLEHILRGSVPI